jgi:hypothetical protein
MAYTFRGVDKDPTEICRPITRHVHQQAHAGPDRASFPGGSVVVHRCCGGRRAARPTREVVCPTIRRGEFRSAFRCTGTIEEYDRGKDGAGTLRRTEIINGEEMWKRMDASCADRRMRAHFSPHVSSIC